MTPASAGDPLSMSAPPISHRSARQLLLLGEVGQSGRSPGAGDDPALGSEMMACDRAADSAQPREPDQQITSGRHRPGRISVQFLSNVAIRACAAHF